MLKVPCDVYQRVCGYWQPVRKYNKGKEEEYYDRKTFSEQKSLDSEILKEKEKQRKKEIKKILEGSKITKIGKYDKIIIGHDMCGGCKDRKKELLNNGAEFAYISFERIDQVESLAETIGIVGEINLPMEIESSRLYGLEKTA